MTTRPSLALRELGSVARGDAREDSDIDIIVDLNPDDRNFPFRARGLNEEFRRILGRDVDVFTPALLRRHSSSFRL